MRILTLNAGSGSLKAALFDLGTCPRSAAREGFACPADPVWRVMVDSSAPDQPPDSLTITLKIRDSAKELGKVPRHETPEVRMSRILRLLAESPALGPPPDAVAHRVVHGGEKFTAAVRITPEVEAEIDRLGSFAPLHNPVNLAGIRAAREVFSGIPQTAVFDTAFHRRMPLHAQAYAGPASWLKQGILRYGFHGTSFRWAAGRAPVLLGRPTEAELSLIICHLGGGCSLCAVSGGLSIDTTMGFTPLDGVAMCTRSGSVDPGILLHLMRSGADAETLGNLLNRQSGLLGLSGTSGDTRVLIPLADKGHEGAAFALRVFQHRLRQGVGQMLGSLGRVPDALVFTDAIGETVPSIRSAVCGAFEFLGLQLDQTANLSQKPDSGISLPGSTPRVLLVTSREDWQMVRETVELLA